MRNKNVRYNQRKNRVKASISLGTAERPRLSVNRTNTRLSVQLIDDEKQVTLFGFDTRVLKPTKDDTKSTLSHKLGMMVADKAKELKVKKMVFDRNGFLYHGRVKALCEGVREGGIQI